MQAIKHFPHEPFPLLAELKLFNNTEEGEKKPSSWNFIFHDKLDIW